jgi:ATP-dependent exoDNAse (exonuclease V) alpha subunit
MLNRKTPSGMPPHRLVIKKNEIVMLIVNVSVEDGLCNGTRMRVVDWTENTILLAFIDGPRCGQTFLLFRWIFRQTDGDEDQQLSVVKWIREQFPIRPGFVLTSNKSQGQTLERVGIVLDKTQCFSHGQAYVAVSRGKNRQSTKILLPNKITNMVNVVQKRIVGEDDYQFSKSEWEREAKNCNFYIVFIIFSYSKFFY